MGSSKFETFNSVPQLLKPNDCTAPVMSNSPAPNSATNSPNNVDTTPCTPRKRALSLVTPAMRRLRSIVGAEQLLHKAVVRLQCRHRGHRSRHEQKQNLRYIVTVQAIARGAKVRLGWRHVLGSKRLPQSLKELRLVLQAWHQPDLPAFAVTKRQFAALFCNIATATGASPQPKTKELPNGTTVVSPQPKTKEVPRASEALKASEARTPSRPTQPQSSRSQERQSQRRRASNRRQNSISHPPAAATSAAEDASCDLTDPEVDRIFAGFAAANGGEHVHVLLVFASIAMMCTGTTTEKLRFIFELFDMSVVGTLNKDQLTILFTLCEQSFALVSGGSMPAPERTAELADSVINNAGTPLPGVDSVSASAKQHVKAVGLEDFCSWATSSKDVGNFVMRLRKGRCRDLLQSSPAVLCVPNTNTNTQTSISSA